MAVRATQAAVSPALAGQVAVSPAPRDSYDRDAVSPAPEVTGLRASELLLAGFAFIL